MEKFELAGPGWMRFLRERLEHYAAAAGPQPDVSICEVFTGVPKHLDKHRDGTIAWHCYIKNGSVDFAETAIPEADVHTILDYEFLLPIARRTFTPEAMAEVQAYLAKGVAGGKSIPLSRDRSKVPAFFIQLHNDLAAMIL